MSTARNRATARAPRTALAAVLLLAGAGLHASCTTDGPRRPETRATQGVVVGFPVDVVWSVVQSTLPGARSAGAPMSARTRVRGVPVEARVQRHASGGTILDVTSDDPQVAEEVQLAIQRELLAR